jgi:streptomycin 6-kinase
VLSRESMEAQARVIAARLELPFRRLIAFTVAHAALAAAWELQDEGGPEIWIAVHEVAISIHRASGPIESDQ